DADSTAWASLLLSTVSNRGSARVSEAAECLARHQRHEGGLSTYFEPGPIRRYMRLDRRIGLEGWCAPHTDVTATAGIAFAARGGEWRAKSSACWDFVRPRQSESGCWQSYWWGSPYYPTLQAVELATAFGERQSIERARTWALREQNDDGGWGTPTSSFAT